MNRHHRTRTLLFSAVGSVLVAASLLVLLIDSRGGLLPQTIIPLAAGDMEPAGGSAFSARNAPLGRALQKPVPALAAVTEDGIPLPLRAASSQKVKDGTGGEFAIGGKRVWFCPTDRTDPKTNGRAYAVALPTHLPPRGVAAAWAALATGLLFLVRARFRVWLWVAWAGDPKHRKDQQQAASGREQGLDVLRAAAVLLVLPTHALRCPEEASAWLHALTSFLGGMGWIGVDLFFVLSGYLVSGLLFEESRRSGTVNLGRFLCRRGLKIYPAHWFMVGVSLVMASFGFEPAVTADKVIGDLLYLQNYIGAGIIGPGSLWGHTWTLAVEEHFYLLLAFTITLSLEAGRDRRGSAFEFIPRLFAWIAFLCLAMRCLRVFFQDDPFKNYILTHLRLDALMFGVFLRHVRTTQTERFDAWVSRFRWTGLILAPVLLLPAFLLEHTTSTTILTVGLSLSYVAAGCLLLSASAWEKSPPAFLRRLWHPFILMGRHSYSIYLWHVPLGAWLGGSLLDRLTPPFGPLGNWLAYAGVYYGGAIAGGILLSKLIEQPALRLRDKVFPSLSGSPAVSRGER